MTITFSSRTVALSSAAAVLAAGGWAAAVPAFAPAPAAAGRIAATHVTGQAATGVVSAPAAVTAREQRAVTRYWTPARMAAATPAGSRAPSATAAASARRTTAPWLTGNTAGRGLRWTYGGAVARTTGKVFFTLGGKPYVCSGSVVASPHSDVVLTAAHCVSDGAGQWVANWTFVPGYRDGTEPYGSYTARRFFVSPRWQATTAEQYDVAFVQVNAATADGPRPHAEVLPPGAPVAFAPRQDAPLGGEAYVFGYPAEWPYSGLYPNYCAGQITADRQGDVRTTCTMTAGDSGGPWFTGFRPQPGTGTIVAVSTYKLTNDMRVLYGAVLGPAARALYQQASLSPAR